MTGLGGDGDVDGEFRLAGDRAAAMSGYENGSPVASHGNRRARGVFRRAVARVLGMVRFLAGVAFVVVAGMPEGMRMPGWLLLAGLVALLVLVKPPWLWRWRSQPATGPVVEGDRARAWLFGSGLALLGAALAAGLDSTRTDMGIIGAVAFGELVGFGVRTGGPSLRIGTRTEIAFTVTALGIVPWQYVTMRQDLDTTDLPLFLAPGEVARWTRWYAGAWFAEGLLWLVALGFAAASARRTVDRLGHVRTAPPIGDRSAWLLAPPAGDHRPGRQWAVLAVAAGVAAFVALARLPVPLPAQEAALRRLDEAANRQLRADRVGDCFALPPAGAAPNTPTANLTGVLNGTLGRVPCSKPHDAEVFYTFRIARDADPGNADVRECDSHLAAYVGAGYADATYNDYVTTPVPYQWAAGDHRASCLLFRNDRRPMVGTARMG